MKAFAYVNLGMFRVDDVVHGRAGEDMARTIVKNLEKGRDLHLSIGSTQDARSAECYIDNVKQIFAAMGIMEVSSMNTKEHLDFLREQYKHQPNDQTGMNLSSSLFACDHNIELQRFGSELVRNSRRVNGDNHEITRKLEAHFNEVTMTRKVRLMTRYKEELYYALRHVDDGAKCVVKGPILQSRILENELTFAVNTCDTIPQLGTPVICHGLKNSTNLNGKIGDTRKYDGKIDRYEVHFEDPSLGVKCVKRQNVRVLFELPELQNDL